MRKIYAPGGTRFSKEAPPVCTRETFRLDIGLRYWQKYLLIYSVAYFSLRSPLQRAVDEVDLANYSKLLHRNFLAHKKDTLFFISLCEQAFDCRKTSEYRRGSMKYLVERDKGLRKTSETSWTISVKIIVAVELEISDNEGEKLRKGVPK